MSEFIEDVVENRHLRPEQTQGRTMYEGHVLVDLNHLVAECRSLRMEMAQNEPMVQFLNQIRGVRQSIERAHDAEDAEAHLARMLLVGQMQILDAVLQIGKSHLSERP